MGVSHLTYSLALGQPAFIYCQKQCYYVIFEKVKEEKLRWKNHLSPVFAYLKTMLQIFKNNPNFTQLTDFKVSD
jgi:hypothetical protein